MESRKTVLKIVMCGGKGNTDIKNKILDMLGKGKGGMICENSIETYILPYVEEIASGNLPNDAGIPKLVFCDHLEGWEGQEGGRGIKEGGNICIPTANFMLMYAKTITIF